MTAAIVDAEHRHGLAGIEHRNIVARSGAGDDLGVRIHIHGDHAAYTERGAATHVTLNPHREGRMTARWVDKAHGAYQPGVSSLNGHVPDQQSGYLTAAQQADDLQTVAPIQFVQAGSAVIAAHDPGGTGDQDGKLAGRADPT
jgi:hypothetical protein